MTVKKDEEPLDLKMWSGPGWDAVKETSRRLADEIAAERARKPTRWGMGRQWWALFLLQGASLSVLFAAAVNGWGAVAIVSAVVNVTADLARGYVHRRDMRRDFGP